MATNSDQAAERLPFDVLCLISGASFRGTVDVGAEGAYLRVPSV